jgi:hypothetical protein
MAEGMLNIGRAAFDFVDDIERMSDQLQLKYHTVNDATEQLGGIPAIREAFIGFQQYLYE